MINDWRVWAKYFALWYWKRLVCFYLIDKDGIVTGWDKITNSKQQYEQYSGAFMLHVLLCSQNDTQYRFIFNAGSSCFLRLYEADLH